MVSSGLLRRPADTVVIPSADTVNSVLVPTPGVGVNDRHLSDSMQAGTESHTMIPATSISVVVTNDSPRVDTSAMVPGSHPMIPAISVAGTNARHLSDSLQADTGRHTMIPATGVIGTNDSPPVDTSSMTLGSDVCWVDTSHPLSRFSSLDI